MEASLDGQEFFISKLSELSYVFGKRPWTRI